MNKLFLTSLAVSSMLVLSTSLPATAAGHNTMEMHYQVTITNLTSNQPLSPPALVVHDMGYMPISIGQPASTGLEHLAEGGETALWLAEARMHESVYRTQAGDMVIPPGEHAEFMLMVPANLEQPMLSGATMLVNTNDAFAAFTALPLHSLEVEGSMHFMANVYDAGTEMNSETAATIPGPAGGGEGFNSEREAADRVSLHPGVVTHDDGMEMSVLDESHRFQNPALAVMVTRMADTASETVLQFASMQHQYNAGDQLRIVVEEMSSLRTAPTDLWFAMQQPDGVVMYFTPMGLTLERQPFKTQVPVNETMHTLLDIVVPEGLMGAYTVFAVYGELQDERLQLHSAIAQQRVWLMP